MKTIEVYIENKEIKTPSRATINNGLSPLSKWSNIPWEALPEVPSSYRIISEEDRRALEMAEKLAERTGAKLKVYDVCTRTGKVLAYLRRVKSTPTIIIDGKKLETLPKEGDLYPQIMS